MRKSTQKLYLVTLLLGVCFLSALLTPLSTFAQGTAFTYSGFLTDQGGPANGVYDFEFRVFDAVSGGAQQGSLVTINDLGVTNGLFTVPLDPGANVFTGPARWLNMAVRPGVSTGAYTNVVPRQPITAAPYAVYAGGASAAGVTGTLPSTALSGTYGGVVNFSNVNNTFAGNGGGLTNLNSTNLVGTIADARLSTNVALLNGTNVFTGTNRFAGVVVATNVNNQFTGTFTGNGAGVTNLNVNATNFNGVAKLTGGNTFSGTQIFTNGNVGIGTTNPGAKLDVNGTIAASGAYLSGSGAATLTFSDALNDAGKSWVLFDAYYGAGNFGIARYDPALGGFPSDRNIVITPAGNVGIGKADPATKLDVAGEVTCVAVNLTSDRNAKEDFKPVSSREVLAKVAALPITEWQYKKQSDARHIGPMAQDFHAAFGTGRDDKHIASVDADGVALAAIQGLNEKLEEKSAEVESLKQSVAELKELVKQLTHPASR